MKDVEVNQILEDNESFKYQLNVSKYKEDKIIGFFERSIADKERELECPTCLEVAPPPLYMCQDSHLICSACRPRLDRCPLCRVPLSGTVRRHRFAEKLYQDVKELELQREMIDGA